MPSVVRRPCFSLAWLPEACLAEKAKLQFLAENMAGAVTGEQRPPDREPRDVAGTGSAAHGVFHILSL